MLDRRKFLGAGAGVMAAAAVPVRLDAVLEAPAPNRRGRIKQGLWKTVFGDKAPLSFDEMCRLAAHLGVKGFDLIPPEDWPVLKKYGLRPLMVDSQAISFEDGIIHAELHDKIEADFRPWIKRCADNGVYTLALLGGQKRGMEPERALDNAVAFANRIKAELEDAGLIAAIENVNDRNPTPGYGRPDQIFGPFAWGVEFCKRVNSPNVRLLCDVYHLQMQDGDLTRTITENIDLIAHIHVSGAPTRNEIDGSQEVNYRYIAETIAATGFDGYVAHEWRPGPGRDPLKSIAQALEIMDA